MEKFGKGTETIGGVVIEPIASEIRNDLPVVIIPGWGAVKLPAGETQAEMQLYNPEKNEGYYDLSLSVFIYDLHSFDVPCYMTQGSGLTAK